MPLQSFIRTSAEYRRPNSLLNPTSSASPLHDTTNSHNGSSHQRSRSSSFLTSLKRQNKGQFSLKGPKHKASATVALTPTSASAGSSTSSGDADPLTGTSVIPFPAEYMDTDCDSDDDARSCISETGTQSPTGHKRRALHSVTGENKPQRKRCITPLTTLSGLASTPNASGSESGCTVRTRPRSSSLPTTLKPTSKRSKNSKRVVADVQFVAAVHRSIVSRISLREYAARLSDEDLMDVDMESGRGAKGDGDKSHMFEAQERLLVEKLWEYLVGLGCEPSLLDDPFLSATPESSSGKVSDGLSSPSK